MQFPVVLAQCDEKREFFRKTLPLVLSGLSELKGAMVPVICVDTGCNEGGDDHSHPYKFDFFITCDMKCLKLIMNRQGGAPACACLFCDFYTDGLNKLEKPELVSYSAESFCGVVDGCDCSACGFFLASAEDGGRNVTEKENVTLFDDDLVQLMSDAWVDVWKRKGGSMSRAEFEKTEESKAWSRTHCSFQGENRAHKNTNTHKRARTPFPHMLTHILKASIILLKFRFLRTLWTACI